MKKFDAEFFFFFFFCQIYRVFNRYLEDVHEEV